MEQSNNQIVARPAQKTAVMIRREMVKIPAVMGALGPVEKAVFLASTAKTIAEYDAAELSAELAVALKWICKDVGYRSPDESDRQYLVIRTAEILKRYYSGLTLKDFRMAFEMSITGELDDFLPRGRDGQPDRNHYQQFNAEYICKILNAYKGRRASVLRKAYEAAPQEGPRPNPEREQYYSNEIRKDCIRGFEFFKETGRLPDMTPIAEMLYYKELAAVGLADKIEITLDDQKEILQRTINDYARRGYIGDVRRLKESGTSDPELEHGSFVLARRKALAATFRRMVEQEIQITDYIKFEQ
jgi:hypothetical protein